MAILTKEQLKAVFGNGKFPTEQNWSDFIDSIYDHASREGLYAQESVIQVSLNGYAQGALGVLGPSDLNLQNLDYRNAWSGGNLNIEYPIDIADIAYKETTNHSWFLDRNNSTVIMVIHNNGFYYSYCNNEDAHKVYIKWHRDVGEAGAGFNVASDTKIAVIPLGGCMAFARTKQNGSWQPIGQYISIDANAVTGSKTAYAA